MVQAVNIVKEYGARDVYLCFVHPVLSGTAAERLAALPLKRDRHHQHRARPSREARACWATDWSMLSVAPLLGEVIRRAHEGRSVGEMFNE